RRCARAVGAETHSSAMNDVNVLAAVTHLAASLPGLTRQSIRFARALLSMDAPARVPGAAQHGAKRNDAQQTRDRYTHRLRDGPGPAMHRFAIARAAPHPGHEPVRPGTALAKL